MPTLAVFGRTPLRPLDQAQNCGFWYSGIVLGIVGTVVAVTGVLLR